MLLPKHLVSMKKMISVIVALPLLFITIFTCAAAYTDKQCYVVYMGAHEHKYPVITMEQQTIATKKHYELLSSVLGSAEVAKDSMIYSYTKYINGFSAILNSTEAKMLAADPHVVSVFASKPMKLQTTYSMGYLSLEQHTNSGRVMYGELWEKAKFGKNMIIGNLDSGVWPESKSFRDDGYGPVPKRWNGNCKDNPQAKHPVICNKKLIGAKYFHEGYKAYAAIKKINVDGIFTARDTNGHGTHTLSTAGGHFVNGVNVYGLGNGTAKGSAPHARVASYKACWRGKCLPDDVLLAFDEAIYDGVDVLSLSVSNNEIVHFNQDPFVIGAFHAVRHGILVVSSAGNYGPAEKTVRNSAPWMLTVAASTMDRKFEASVRLGNGLLLKGSSVSPRFERKKNYRLIKSQDAKKASASGLDAYWCLPGSLNSTKVKGNIVVCTSGIVTGKKKAREVKLAGGAGMILCNNKNDQNSTKVGPYILPTVNLNHYDGLAVFKYLESSRKPFGYLTAPKTVMGTKPSPTMAIFSSKGPNIIAPSILKPDITAPGVDIIAAFSQKLHPKKPRIPFSIMSGTSMSCPHVAGIVALLKSIHRHWSPAALMSSLMTTAYVEDNTGNTIRNENQTADTPTPFSYGSGHIRPDRAVDPGLVYDASTVDYLQLLCALNKTSSSQLKKIYYVNYKCPKSPSQYINYPSIAVENLRGSIKIFRRLKNVGEAGVYKLNLVKPPGINVRVSTEILRFTENEEKTYSVILSPKKRNWGQTHVYGKIIWSDGKHEVTSPIAVNVYSDEDQY